MIAYDIITFMCKYIVVGFYDIFAGLDGNYRGQVLGYILEDLKEIADWFSTQQLLQFRGSSLLIVFESDKDRLTSLLSEPTSCRSNIVQVKMIDFVHVWESPILDCNYIDGLNSVIHYFTSLTHLFSNSSNCS